MENLVDGVVAAQPGWSGRRVLVTGATGFVGTWLAKALLDSGAQVVCLVRDADPNALFIRGGIDEQVTIVAGSLQDYFLLERALKQYEIDTVFHLAAEAIVPNAIVSPLSTFESNIRGTWQLLEAVRRTPTVTRTVVASSDKAYGAQPRLPYTEEDPLRGRHPYDASKSCADLLAQAYASTYELAVGITRCANIYGPGDINWSRLIPGTIRSILRRERPVIRSDGKSTRDYLYIADAVEAYLTLGTRVEEPGIRGEPFNFGPGRAVSVLDLAARLLALGPYPELTLDIVNTAKAEIRDQSLSSEKAKRLLGWRPSVGLDEGLERAMKWYQAFLEEDLEITSRT
ncbi:MAG: GDP-mannose 4,6-dehydratase [Candidatus Omnitrophica bacterium]|nr:GDP-mannose 4,6-dehydratase [Candidatus Omnitrophota bacterium]